MRTIQLLLLLTVTFLCSCTSNLSHEEFDNYINQDWQLASSQAIGADGKEISSPNFQTNSWNNIDIPSTVLTGLRQNGQYPDIYYSNNLEKIDTKQFLCSWWYRKEFTISDYSELENYVLMFEGLNYKANIWLNGELIADNTVIEGPFAMPKLDITKFIAEKNVVAVEVFPPVKGDLTIGFVDWNPNTPDQNMGLWRGVRLIRSKGVSIENIVITSDLTLGDAPVADLKIDAELKNFQNKEVKGTLNAQIDGGIEVKIPYTLKANEVKRIVAKADKFPSLKIEKPRLWWPIHMGEPELYNATFTLEADGKTSFVKKERFGIRKIEDYTFIHGENELCRGYKINGEKVLLRGGGWVDDMTLADTDQKVRDQVAYVKHMNLNLIRLEGFWGNTKEIYEACDENGILLMIGLSCQWEWEGYCGRPETEYMMVNTPKDVDLQSKSYQDQVKWGMNNPSIFLWVYGSDKLPTPEFEAALNERIREYDTDRCIMAACKGRWQENDNFQTSSISGNPGSKMLGPYEYVPPVYWYEDNTVGAAYGFNTETGPGAQIPPIESIKKMLSPEDLEKINEEGWQYHCGRNEFQTLDRWLDIYGKRYWTDATAEELAFNAQISNYESIRAMFEAFEVKRTTQSTGIVQWMLNSAWPEMYWQLYDWYLNPNGAFFGTKTALQPLNLIYNYSDHSISWTNNTPDDRNLKAEIRVFDVNSREFINNTFDINTTSFSVGELTKLDKYPPTGVFFLSLKLKNDEDKEISNNFYWLSNERDVLDYTKSTWFYTPQTDFASFKDLKKMKTASLTSNVTMEQKGENVVATVTLKNESETISFFNEMRIVNKETKLNILPVFWSDNYVSILPGEAKTFTATMEGNAQDMELVIKGFNSKKN